MSYQKHIWVKNEIIRGDNLNHIESGIYDEEQRALGAEESLLESIDNEYSRATTEEGILSGRITATESSITTLNGSSSVVGSVDYKIAQATQDMGGYKVVSDHTQVVNPSDKYIYLEPDETATGNDKFEEWIYHYDETQSTYEWVMIGETSLDLSDYVQKTDVATSQVAGLVKPDGTTITVQSDGTIAASGTTSGVSGVKGNEETNYRDGQVNITPSNVGAVAYTANQGLDSTQQANARSNIGAGTSNFDGAYSSLTGTPSIPGGVKIGTTTVDATDTTLYFVRS